MDPWTETGRAFLSTYGDPAFRLAAALARDEKRAREIVAASVTGARDETDWVGFLATVRSTALSGRPTPDTREPAPRPVHPGDAPVGGIPIDAALLYEAYASLPEPVRLLLWDSLLGRADAEVGELAGAMEALAAAVARGSYPSDEDIP